MIDPNREYTGTVVGFSGHKKFGFISIDDSSIFDDALAHCDEIIPEIENGLRKLIKGQRVKFKLIERSRGLKALQIKVIASNIHGDVNGNC